MFVTLVGTCANLVSQFRALSTLLRVRTLRGPLLQFFGYHNKADVQLKQALKCIFSCLWFVLVPLIMHGSKHRVTLKKTTTYLLKSHEEEEGDVSSLTPTLCKVERLFFYSFLPLPRSSHFELTTFGLEVRSVYYLSHSFLL